jgi:hydroxypyruvate reductase
MGEPLDELHALFAAGVAAADPARIVPACVPAGSGQCHVVGAGKAAAAMARALEDHWPADRPPPEGVVVTRYDHGAPLRHIECIEASHPVPDAAGQAAAQRILAIAESLGADDHLLVLLSGGGSALLSLPAAGLSLEDKQAVSESLLRCGADIAEINCVRKHLSAIKGGQLAVAASPARVSSLIISDVVGDDPATIASGPTAADPTTLAEAREVLARYGIAVPAAIDRHLGNSAAETPKPGDARLAGVENHRVATPQASLEAMAALARSRGITPVILGDSIEGEAREVGRVMAGIARQVARHHQPAAPPCVLLSGGETSVTVHGGGRGGRNVEFLLGLAIALDGEESVHALAADSDGIDGTEDNAGAVITPDTLARARRAGLDPRARLADNDAYGFFAALQDRLMTGPTRTNVNDLRAVLIGQPP